MNPVVHTAKTIFITGNSRSGTTMMMRIMDNHSQVHSINEPHFFEKMWTPADQDKQVSTEEAEQLLLKLIVGQREGFFAAVEKYRTKYLSEVKQIVNQHLQKATRLQVYQTFLDYETRLNGKSIPCEKTPQNVFYQKEILENFPGGVIINMVRDPRGVMLSQKRKWKRKFLGADFLTYREILRLRINYHPLTISKLWNAAVSAGSQFQNHERVIIVRFEDLVKDPQQVVKEVCERVEIPFEEKMLLIPHAGSSSEADNKESLGIKSSRAAGWKEKGLTDTEVRICQRQCAEYMQQYRYEFADVSNNMLNYIWQHLIFPPKVFLALLVNLGRMRNIGDTLRRRLNR